MTLKFKRTFRALAFFVASFSHLACVEAAPCYEEAVADCRVTSASQATTVYEVKTSSINKSPHLSLCENVRRCVIELGSSNAKFFCAEGNSCTGIFEPAQDTGKKTLNLPHYMNNGFLTSEGMQIIIDAVLAEIDNIVDKEPRALSQVAIVATAAIRNAHNAHEIEARFSQESGGIPMTILSQEQEAALAVATAYAHIGTQGQKVPKDVIFLDQGGGSTQVVEVNNGVIVENFFEESGTHHVVGKLKELFKNSKDDRLFPFAPSGDYGDGLLESLYSHVATLFQTKGTEIRGFFPNTTVAYGVSRAHQFCILPIANPSGNYFTIHQVGAAIERFSVLNERQILEKYPSVQNPQEDFATMFLTYSLMRYFGVDRIDVLPMPTSSLASAINFLPHWTTVGPRSRCDDHTFGRINKQ